MPTPAHRSRRMARGEVQEASPITRRKCVLGVHEAVG